MQTGTTTGSVTTDYLARRQALLRRPGPPGPGRRAALVQLTDEWLTQLFELSGNAGDGAALVAVGGYGRGELAVGSDLDLLLLQRTSSGGSAEKLWYPIWDSGLRLDHSVRTVPEARKLAGEDFKVLLGLLDARTVAGDDTLTAGLLSSVRADWRASAFKRLAEVYASVQDRREQHGDLAHLLEPDLKESYGGLRDLVVLRAIAASWVTDAPHGSLDQPKQLLLDVRDALHRVTGKPVDRLLMQEHNAVAVMLGMNGPDDLMRAVSAASRRISWASDETWYRANRATRPTPRRIFSRLSRRTDRRPLADGVIEYQGDVVLATNAHPEEDPILVLRAAAAAAHAGLQLTPHTLERLAEDSAPMPVPWPDAARDALVSLLGAGGPLVRVWESLDQFDITIRLLPQWEHIRNAPQHNPVHRFTVDRHLIETVVHAAQLQREVARPDLLLVAALLHDIGKGRPGQNHSEVGVDIVRELAPDLGFGATDAEVLLRLVRHHLLLPEVATRRDPEDPATLQLVVAAVEDLETLELLHALTRADASATGPIAWTEWRAALVSDLVTQVRGALSGAPPAPAPDLADEYADLISQGETEVVISDAAPGELVKVIVVSPDHPGLLADIAGVLSVNRLDVKAAQIGSVGGMGITQWWVNDPFGGRPSAARIRDTMKQVRDGSLDVAEKVARREADYARGGKVWALDPRVDVVSGVSERATVLEVRTYDRPGTMFRLARAIAGEGVNIVAARADTRGSSVVDVFYLADPGGGPLSDELTTETVEQLLTAAQGS